MPPVAFPATGVAGPATVSFPSAMNPGLLIPYSMQCSFINERQQCAMAVRLSSIGTNTRKGVVSYSIGHPVADTWLSVDKPRLYPRCPGDRLRDERRRSPVPCRNHRDRAAHQGRHPFPGVFHADARHRAPRGRRIARRLQRPQARTRRPDGHSHPPPRRQFRPGIAHGRRPSPAGRGGARLERAGVGLAGQRGLHPSERDVPDATMDGTRSQREALHLQPSAAERHTAPRSPPANPTCLIPP